MTKKPAAVVDWVAAYSLPRHTRQQVLRLSAQRSLLKHSPAASKADTVGISQGPTSSHQAPPSRRSISSLQTQAHGRNEDPGSQALCLSAFKDSSRGASLGNGTRENAHLLCSPQFTVGCGVHDGADGTQREGLDDSTVDDDARSTCLSLPVVSRGADDGAVDADSRCREGHAATDDDAPHLRHSSLPAMGGNTYDGAVDAHDACVVRKSTRKSLTFRQRSKQRCSGNQLPTSKLESTLTSPHSLTAITSVVDKQLPPLLSAEFFKCDALDLAPNLLGKFLRRDDVVLQITEVEAYRPNDSACHGRFGITARTAPVFGPGGHAYVYLCYGMHIMLNIVADIEGVGAAVLIRSCAPVAGLEAIQARRQLISEKPVLLTGPGKVGQALGLTTDWSNHPLYTSGGLEVLDGPAPEKILVGPRVGIDYAAAHDVAALWRFAVAGTPWISAPRNTLRPPNSS